MGKQLPVIAEGIVLETLGNGLFKVQLIGGHDVICRPSGKMRMHRINILAGDSVTIEMSPYDLKRGRIVKRTIKQI